MKMKTKTNKYFASQEEEVNEAPLRKKEESEIVSPKNLKIKTQNSIFNSNSEQEESPRKKNGNNSNQIKTNKLKNKKNGEEENGENEVTIEESEKENKRKSSTNNKSNKSTPNKKKRMNLQFTPEEELLTIEEYLKKKCDEEIAKILKEAEKSIQELQQKKNEYISSLNV